MIAEVQAQGGTQLPGERVFMLYDTHGFPLELTEEIAHEQGLTVDLVCLRGGTAGPA